MNRASINERSATGVPSAFVPTTIRLLCPNMMSCDGLIYALLHFTHYLYGKNFKQMHVHHIYFIPWQQMPLESVRQKCTHHMSFQLTL
jgi:hypothetical protein